MTVALTIRDVPEDVRDELAASARARGQSMQAYLLSVLGQQARFRRNLARLDEIADDLRRDGGAGDDAPRAVDLIAAERARRLEGPA